MAIVELPVDSNSPSYFFTIDLEGQTYTLKLRHNSRMDRWIFDVQNEDGEPLCIGLPILTLVDLFGIYSTENFPPGIFLAFDESGENKNAGRNDLGNDVVFLYQESEETA